MVQFGGLWHTKVDQHRGRASADRAGDRSRVSATLNGQIRPLDLDLNLFAGLERLVAVHLDVREVEKYVARDFIGGDDSPSLLVPPLTNRGDHKRLGG